MEKTLAYDWLAGIDHSSLAFRAFIDHMWTHYPQQVKIMVGSFIEGDGKEMFEIYLNEISSSENQANCKADHQMERDNG